MKFSCGDDVDMYIQYDISLCTVCLYLGLSPDLQSMEQIRRIMRPTDVPDTGKCILGSPGVVFRRFLAPENIPLGNGTVRPCSNESAS